MPGDRLSLGNTATAVRGELWSLLHYTLKPHMRNKQSMIPVPTLSSAERVAAERPGKFIYLTPHI